MHHVMMTMLVIIEELKKIKEQMGKFMNKGDRLITEADYNVRYTRTVPVVRHNLQTSSMLLRDLPPLYL